MRVVVDTNVLVSALLWGGTPKQFLELAVEADIEFLTSDTLLEELARVLSRAKFAAKLAGQQISAEQIAKEYREQARIITVSTVPAPQLRDPKDHHVLACALAAQANLIISGDHDLLELKEYRGIPIVTAAAAMQVISR